MNIATSAHKVSQNQARTQVLLQAPKLHVYGSGTFGAFWAPQAHDEGLPEDVVVRLAVVHGREGAGPLPDREVPEGPKG